MRCAPATRADRASATRAPRHAYRRPSPTCASHRRRACRHAHRHTRRPWPTCAARSGERSGGAGLRGWKSPPRGPDVPVCAASVCLLGLEACSPSPPRARQARPRGG
ncbi:Hypothetical protein A7982_09271 [Minicystis rosea]|nr:Hypothetical protein A7982_09271 [Minicystis rosea]